MPTILRRAESSKRTIIAPRCDHLIIASRFISLHSQVNSRICGWISKMDLITISRWLHTLLYFPLGLCSCSSVLVSSVHFLSASSWEHYCYAFRALINSLVCWYVINSVIFDLLCAWIFWVWSTNLWSRVWFYYNVLFWLTFHVAKAFKTNCLPFWMLFLL